MEKRTHIERVLIVLNEDGTLKAAHQESLERVFDGDEIYAERQLGAEPLDGETLVEILDNANVLAQVSVLEKEIERLAPFEAEVIALRPLVQINEDLRNEIELLNQTIANQESVIKAAQDLGKQIAEVKV